MGIYHLEAVEGLDSRVRVLDKCRLGWTVDVFLAGVTVPSLLVRFCPDEC